MLLAWIDIACILAPGCESLLSGISFGALAHFLFNCDAAEILHIGVTFDLLSGPLT